MSPPKSHDSHQVWYTKGFIEGLRRSRQGVQALSKQSQDLARVLYELEEEKMLRRESQSLLEDTTSMLQEMQQLIVRPKTNKSSSMPVSSAPTTGSQLSMAPDDYIKDVENLVPGYYTSSTTDNSPDPIIERALCSLFQTAQSGPSSKEFTLVKALCREAHGVPPKKRTYGQKYVLKKWRNPETASWKCVEGSEPLTNPQAMDPPEVWYAYFKIYTNAWPRGVQALPNSCEPIYELVVGSRIFARLRPALGELRSEFASAAIALFTVTGKYRKFITEGHIPLAAEKMYRTFDTRTHEGSLTVDDVAIHYASCGISVEEAETCVEPWARCYEQDARRRGSSSSKSRLAV
ncbi:hypothetical protein GYMLUDRAFT_50707 [Collybiopsis luxurians FD-317 M1]|uniref:Uncharacterized protein n=1 Tax=Collybiopsis luxurians FD-317 M1 TaxID=944289 RepID=A0A0D0BNT6_9AGAR|nr:hypothetical protein GYMLUDRAFT_50707 [Collybiopsis luxurians FD-317 M1]